MGTRDDGPPEGAGEASVVSLDASLVSVTPDAFNQKPASPRPDPWLGRVVGGRFKILENIGQGGMAVVYRAQEQGIIRRDVAIKLLSPESALSQGILARFLKEAQIIADIRHPNVVQVIDVGRTDDGHLYLAMELLVGHSLHQEIREVTSRGEVFSWERASAIALQVCAALQAAHRRGVVHRDIKPNNCYCIEVDGSTDFIKLLDFGIAKAQIGSGSEESLATPLTQEGMFLGTPHYAAPEVITQDPRWPIDGRADIFALGVMLYQMLTGSLPFQGASKLDVMYKTVHERPISPRARTPEHNIPLAVDALVMTAISIDPRERFSGVIAMAEAIWATLQPRFATLSPTDSGSGRSGGVLVSGSIVELGASTPGQHSAVAARQQPPRRVTVRVQSQEGDGTPPPPGVAQLTQGMQPPTLAEPTTPRRGRLAGQLAVSAVMLGAVAVLLVLLLNESGDDADRVEVTQSSPSPPATPAQPPRAPSVEPPSLPPPSEPVVDLQPAPVAEEVALKAIAEPEVESTPEKIPPQAEESRVSVDLGPRKQRVRERVRELAQGDAILRCLPHTVLLADGVVEQLAVVVSVDAAGRTRATAKAGGVKRRLPKSADPCILKLIAGLRFPPADAAVTVPFTLDLD